MMAYHCCVLNKELTLRFVLNTIMLAEWKMDWRSETEMKNLLKQLCYFGKESRT
jgi:hypothetical protein